MASDPHGAPAADLPDSGVMPRPRAWPLVLSLGLVLVALGVATNLAIAVTGVVLFVFGLAGWVVQLLPGRGPVHESRVPQERRPQVPAGAVGTVSRLGTGMPGYRLRLPV